MEIDGFEILGDTEIVQIGDIVKDIGAGEYREIADSTYDSLLVGMRVASACSCASVNAILRRVK